MRRTRGRRRAPGPVRDQRGSGTVLVVVQAGVLMFLGVALAAVAAVVHQHRVAQAAADLAALAAARTQSDGGDACSVAREIARANRSAVTRCAIAGRDVTVDVSTPPPTWPPWLPDLRATARAGPAGPADRALGAPS